jgi:hypothetical protein
MMMMVPPFGMTLEGRSPKYDRNDDFPKEGWEEMKRLTSGPMVVMCDMLKRFQDIVQE